MIVVDATNLVQESMQRVESWPPATIHLGQALMAAILLQAATDKTDTERVALQWNVDGPFGTLYAESSRLGHVRGTVVVPQAPIADLDTSLGQGTLQVRRITETTFTGIVPSHGNVSDDIVEYLERSEQRRCGVNFTVKLNWQDTGNTRMPFVVEAAYGYLIDVLPQPTEEKLRNVLSNWDSLMRGLGKISEWELGNDPTNQMLKLLTGESEPSQVLYQRIRFHCPCSKQRAERALLLAANVDGQEEQAESEQVRCEFCGKVYTITKAYN